jgi:hypothetical protein
MIRGIMSVVERNIRYDMMWILLGNHESKAMPEAKEVEREGSGSERSTLFSLVKEQRM